MSQIASFYLLKGGQRQELPNGNCSGSVYMAIWDWCERELDLDVRFPAPQTEDTLDCALLEGELASQLLASGLNTFYMIWAWLGWNTLCSTMRRWAFGLRLAEMNQSIWNAPIWTRTPRN